MAPLVVLAVGLPIPVIMFFAGAALSVTGPLAQPPVGLGTATPFAVLAGTTVTNTGPSVISGDLGVSPGTAITGFPPGQVIHGVEHAGDSVALQAQADLTTAYVDAAGRTPATQVPGDIGGETLAPGVYKADSALGLTGTVTLDAQGDPSAVFIFQVGSTLITASSSTVALINGAQACNVFWQVGSSATLGTDTTFVGTVMALTSASLDTGSTVAGRILARNGQVSLDDNTIIRPHCSRTTPTTSIQPTDTSPITSPPTTSIQPTTTSPITTPPTTSIQPTTTSPITTPPTTSIQPTTTTPITTSPTTTSPTTTSPTTTSPTTTSPTTTSPTTTSPTSTSPTTTSPTSTSPTTTSPTSTSPTTTSPTSTSPTSPGGHRGGGGGRGGHFPGGHPHTGDGAPAPSTDGMLVPLGVLALLGACGAAMIATLQGRGSRTARHYSATGRRSGRPGRTR